MLCHGSSLSHNVEESNLTVVYETLIWLVTILPPVKFGSKMQKKRHFLAFSALYG